MPAPQHCRTPATAFVAALLAAACADERRPIVVREPTAPAAAVAGVAATEGVTPLGTIALPINQSVSTSGVAFGVTQTGTGPNGQFVIGNSGSLATALYAVTGGKGLAAFFQNSSHENTNPALRVRTGGTGPAGEFIVNNANSVGSALSARTDGHGSAARFVGGPSASPNPVVSVSSSREGAALRLSVSGSGGGADIDVVSGHANTSPALQVYTTGRASAGRFHSATPGENPTMHVSTYSRSQAGLFEILTSDNGSSAVYARTKGTGPAVTASTTGSGYAVAARSSGTVSGTGAALDAYVSGVARAASLFVANPGSSSAALYSQTIGSGWAGDFRGTSKGVRVITNSGTGLQVSGGTKQAVVPTPSGARSLYTEESSEVWFTDYGFGKLADGRARVLLDPAFAQTVNVEEPYHVFVQAYGDAELVVRERTPLGFVVELREGAERDAEFSYRVVARRLGFERVRLEPAPWADRTSPAASAPGGPLR